MLLPEIQARLTNTLQEGFRRQNLLSSAMTVANVKGLGWGARARSPSHDRYCTAAPLMEFIEISRVGESDESPAS
jgi:hypothetical protein